MVDSSYEYYRTMTIETLPYLYIERERLYSVDG